MFTARFHKALTVPRVLHLLACLLGTALVVLFAVFVVGNQPPIEVLKMPEMWALLLMIAGFLVVWHNDLVGGAMSVIGTAAFYLMNYESAGNFPSGWVFPLCFVPGVLAIMAGMMRSRAASPR